jgi:ATP-dependent RNA helicase RhlE
MSFEILGLVPELTRALADQGYTTPTPVQAEAIPLGLAGRDLMAGAQTGTGKTAAFALPLLQRLFNGEGRPAAAGKRPRALVLTPTRELAAQVHDSFRTYGKHLRVRSGTIFGGVGMQPQIELLRRGVDILVATPGRLMDHMERRSVDLSGIEILVLDEADRMLDMGFLPAVKRILGVLPKQNRQTLLFSATFSDEIKALAAQFMRDPAGIQIAQRNSIAEGVTHRVHPVDAARKRDLLLELLSRDSRRQTLVFGRTKHGSDKLAKFLEASGLRCAVIHGNKSQGARTKALRDFKDGRATIMVATDIAARGIDIDQLPVVINYDLPMVAEDYVHRIGRTGRAGAEGQAISLVSADESGLLRDIQRLLKRDIEMEVVAGFEPTQPLRMAPGQSTPKPGANRSQANRGPRPHGNRGGGSGQPANASRPAGAARPSRDGAARNTGGGNPHRHAEGNQRKPGAAGAGSRRNPRGASRA